MKLLFDALTDYLEAKDLRYSRTEDYDSLTVCYHLKNARVTCSIHIDEEKRYLSCCTRAGIIVPKDKFDAVAEFIARANYGMGIGSFQFNYENGDVFFKTAILADDTELSPNMIRPFLYQNMNTYDLLYPGFMGVLYQNCEPEEAIRIAKSMSKPEPSQEEIDAIFAKIMADIYEVEPLSDFDAIRAQAEQSSEGIQLSMKDLVKAYGRLRAGRQIAQNIADKLKSYGLSHEPYSLPHDQNAVVRVFKKENAE